jgi:AraC-like DNA-binding protein
LGTEIPDFIRWTSKISEQRVFTILPDGCRDILLHTTGHDTTASLTHLDMQPRQITLHPGDEMIGYRLRPGLHVNPQDLADITNHNDATALINDAQSKQTDISSAIHALGADNTPVRHAAKQLGVSLRTMQRHLRSLDLPPPEFWRLLGRARRAAMTLASDMPLIDIAGIHGYSDQSHLTRACQHWFGQTPRHIRRNTALLADINQPALGTWTGEQTSIR